MYIIKTYRGFINESVRDKMTPKSDEELSSVTGWMTPTGKFLFAVEHGITSLVKQAVEEGADVNTVSTLYGETSRDLFDTPLGYATYMGFVDMVDILLKAGAKVGRQHAEYPFMDFYIEDTPEMEEVYRRNNTFYGKMTKESVRDMMKPRDKDKILDSFRNATMDEKRKMLFQLQYSSFKNPWVFVDYLRRKLHISEWNEIKKVTNDKDAFYAYDLVGVLKKHQLERIFSVMLNNRDSINESLRDKMTPKTEESIQKSIIDKISSSNIGYFNPFQWGWKFKYEKNNISNFEYWFESGDGRIWIVTIYTDSIRIIDVGKNEYHYFDNLYNLKTFLRNEGFEIKKVNESVRDRMTPKPEEQGEEEFKSLDRLDKASSLYPECVEMFTTGLTFTDVPIVNDKFCDFLKREVDFDVWKTFVPQFKNYLTFDMVLEDLTDEQLIKLYRVIYSLKMRE
jgi:hypothetical protein